MIWKELLYLYAALWAIMALYAAGSLAMMLYHTAKLYINYLKEIQNGDSKQDS